jgi:hypothetical protein
MVQCERVDRGRVTVKVLSFPINYFQVDFVAIAYTVAQGLPHGFSWRKPR